MTRKEAVRLLKGKAYVFYGEKQIKALGMAIEALEQEPTAEYSSNVISRKAAIDALKEHRALYCDNTPETFSKLSYVEKSRVDELDAAIATLVNLPSAQPETPPYVAEIESEYKKWVSMPHINKPLAKALYEVWKKHDREDVSRLDGWPREETDGMNCYECVKGISDNFEALEQEPIIYCKDCKHWHEWENGAGSCHRSDIMWVGSDYYDYCSFAERKEQ